MYTRHLSVQENSFFLLGPRGTGKSTWLRSHYPDAKLIDLLDESLYQDYLFDISLFHKELSSLKKGSWVVVDEIQRLPKLLNDVHRLIESHRLNFALTGSSARKLRSSGVNLLAGRALRKEMYPFLPSELGEDFSLSRALQVGTIPLIWQSKTPEETLSAYVQMYLKEEIKAEALVRNLEGFARFLPVMGLFHSQLLNVSSVARDAGVPRNTIIGFLEILEDTFMLQRLQPFSSRLRVREKRHPKVYWIDPGIARATKKNTGKVSVEEKGALFEGFIFTILRAWNAYHKLYDDIYYWSPAEAKKTEVDFLLSRGTEYLAIEVKSSTKVKSQDYQGLNAIADLRGLKKRILIYLGKTSFRTDNGIDVYTFEDFLKLKRTL